MLAAVRHRGPDGDGIFMSPDATAALGHRRLAIIDLSTRASQPMTTEDGRYTIVFNGEIYNYVELGRELAEEGLALRTTSDSEVLLRGYERWGQGVLGKLLGMFAFAVWDAKERTLFLARDRVGKKPLLYAEVNGTFAFASELKALLALSFLKPRISAVAIDLYLTLGFIPAPHSIIQGVRKLPPGHFMTVSQTRTTITRYWDPLSNPPTVAATPAARVEQGRALIRDAVRLRLRSDVPIALFLSGGVDSSVIAAECRTLGTRVQCLTMTFDADNADLPYAQSVAHHLSLPLEVREARGAEVSDLLDLAGTIYDEPFGDSSSLPSLALSRAVRGSAKVILNGDGGDEAFAGYRHYEAIGIKQFLKSLAVRVGARDGISGDPWQTYLQSRAVFRRHERQGLMRSPMVEDPVREFIATHPYFQQPAPRQPLKLALWADRHLYLPNDLMYKMDIALMSQGIEGRSPFLDHRLLEWAQELPPSDLVSRGQKKAFLRRAYAGDLPNEVFTRPKHGFGAPIRDWLAGPLRERVHSLLPTPLLAPAPQAKLVSDFYDRPGSKAAMRLWVLLLLGLWGDSYNIAT